MDKKLLLLVNPVAGTNIIRNNLLDIVDIFNKAGYEVVVRATQKSGEIPSIIEKHNFDYNVIVCTGGDGTLNEAINGLAGLKLPPMLGYIPAGTVNDFAFSNNIPKQPVQAATQMIKSDGKYYDIGLINENNKAFIYVAAFGLFTNIPYDTPQQSKNILGRFAYGLEGIKQLSQIRSYNITAETDTKTISGDFMLGMITNSKSVGGLEVPTIRESKYDDGLMEVTLIRTPTSIKELNDIVCAIVNNEKCNMAEHLKSTKLNITSDENIDWTVDGEFGLKSKECHIKVLGNKVKIMV